jgi:hypothetical protein
VVFSVTSVDTHISTIWAQLEKLAGLEPPSCDHLIRMQAKRHLLQASKYVRVLVAGRHPSRIIAASDSILLEVS